jgi:hypothetical protein
LADHFLIENGHRIMVISSKDFGNVDWQILVDLKTHLCRSGRKRHKSFTHKLSSVGNAAIDIFVF